MAGERLGAHIFQGAGLVALAVGPAHADAPDAALLPFHALVIHQVSGLLVCAVIQHLHMTDFAMSLHTPAWQALCCHATPAHNKAHNLLPAGGCQGYRVIDVRMLQAVSRFVYHAIVMHKHLAIHPCKGCMIAGLWLAHSMLTDAKVRGGSGDATWTMNLF